MMASQTQLRSITNVMCIFLAYSRSSILCLELEIVVSNVYFRYIFVQLFCSQTSAEKQIRICNFTSFFSKHLLMIMFFLPSHLTIMFPFYRWKTVYMLKRLDTIYKMQYWTNLEENTFLHLKFCKLCLKSTQIDKCIYLFQLTLKDSL